MTKPIDKIEGVDDYLREFVPELVRRLDSSVQPLFDPRKEKPEATLASLLRPPFLAQAHAVTGIVKLLRTQNHAILVGEMGTGKTLMAMAVAHALFGDAYRVLVMAPGHLIDKWRREIVQTIPGAKVRILSHWQDVFPLRDLDGRPKGREFYILARDRAKLGYSWRPAYALRRPTYEKPASRYVDRKKYRERFLTPLPSCPRCAEFILTEDLHPADDAWLSRRKRRCPCGEWLWCADNRKIRRYPPAQFIKDHLKGFADLYIADEVHELKGGATAQGNAFGQLAAAAKKTLALTGTIVGGYAEHLFYLLYRMDPAGLIGEGFAYKEVQHFIARYGALETITRTKLDTEDHRMSRGRTNARVTVKKRPGISPLLFARHLLGSTVFLDLADISDHLPAMSEDVVVVPMSDELDAAYRTVERALKDAMKDWSKAWKLMGTYLQTLLSYPDRPFDTPPIPEVLEEPPELSKKTIYPKERALLDFIADELRAGRKLWVYATFTGRRDVVERLRSLVAAEGHRVELLRRETVPIEEREAWVERQVRRGVDVVISQVELVKTGLDLLAFPSLAFYETGYNTFTLLQAGRRSWRIGQEQPVKIRYYCYARTLQETALQLMGKKIQASLTLQGRFSQEGLIALTQSEDMTTALAKALVGGVEGLESVESYWRNERNAGNEFAVPPLPTRSRDLFDSEPEPSLQLQLAF